MCKENSLNNNNTDYDGNDREAKKENSGNMADAGERGPGDSCQSDWEVWGQKTKKIEKGDRCLTNTFQEV